MDDIIILVDENGEEQEYELLDTVEYEGGRYVVLIQDEDDEVSILQIESEEDEELSLITCEDSVIEEVYQIFKEKGHLCIYEDSEISLPRSNCKWYY